ncbi:helix-turn-helix domain-containing protein, partial [Succinimonas sp.]|uniref:AlbA family DNA-binding domain-containing protein n=1 Tax=Succinimonas sp. TaxID=1936151 RepID=UPI003869C55F
MNIEELLHGESGNIEYREKLPGNSDEYTKTVVAFANTQGGKIVFGIPDGTKRIVGIDADILFQVMDTIAAAIYHSCEPAIVPDIAPCTVDGKNLIVVTVSPGTQRPYYLKSKGKETGTYVRVGVTNRP